MLSIINCLLFFSILLRIIRSYDYGRICGLFSVYFVFMFLNKYSMLMKCIGIINFYVLVGL